MFIQKDNATLHADGSILGPLTNLHFAVLNFPVGLIPALVQAIESSTTDSPVLDLVLVGSEWQFKIQSRASMWQDNLVVTSTRSVDQDVLSPSEVSLQ